MATSDEMENSESDEENFTDDFFAPKIVCSNHSLDLSGYDTKFVCNTCGLKRETSSHVKSRYLHIIIFIRAIGMQNP